MLLDHSLGPRLLAAVPGMIQEFIDSWPLFHDVYIVGWLTVVLLSMVGVLVVARDQIFIGAAVSQASMLGIALGMWLLATPTLHGVVWLQDQHMRDAVLSGFSVVFSILAALLTSRGGEAGRESHESITGWVFLAGASLSVLVVSGSAHGDMQDVERLISSSLIGACEHDVWTFAAAVALVGTFLMVFRRRVLLCLTDQEMAQAVGIRTRVWSAGLSMLLGLTVGLALRSVGVIYTFGCLVLPCLAARNLCRTSLPMLIVGPFLGLGTTVVAFVLANHYDQPPGQMTVALLCAVVGLSALARMARARG